MPTSQIHVQPDWRPPDYQGDPGQWIKDFCREFTRLWLNLGVLVNDSRKLYYQATEPTIPDNALGLWTDSDAGPLYYLLANFGGTQRKIKMATGEVLVEPTLINYSTTSTVSGWAATPTKNIYYCELGDMVPVWFHITGTSNATTASFTLPEVSATGFDVHFKGRAVDNALEQAGGLRGSLANGASTVNLYRCHPGTYTAMETGEATATWTASGTKTLSGQFIYFK